MMLNYDVMEWIKDVRNDNKPSTADERKSRMTLS